MEVIHPTPKDLRAFMVLTSVLLNFEVKERKFDATSLFDCQTTRTPTEPCLRQNTTNQINQQSTDEHNSAIQL